MARKPAIRVSYFNDAQFMLRLIQAIERDTKRSKKWREEQIMRLQTLADAFLHAPPVPAERAA